MDRTVTPKELAETLPLLRACRDRLSEQISRVIVGQDRVRDLLVLACFAGGHTLVIGPPGLAKTSLVNALADSLDLSFQRIQFTADLMPSDIIGTFVFDGVKQVFQKGPVFTNIVLADEINRATPKTQSALLQAMQELKVSVRREDLLLERPFLVFATQNPLGDEGTYPLPEAQLDRFLLTVKVDYPSLDTETDIILKCASSAPDFMEVVVSRPDVLRYQNFIHRLSIPVSIARRAATLAQATRPESPLATDLVRRFVRLGAGSRASVHLAQAARAMAALDGRPEPTEADVDELASAVLAHRIALNFEGEAEGLRCDQVISNILKSHCRS